MVERSAPVTAEAPRRGTRQAQAAETEAALKQAALVVFARLGYLNTKIIDITREAGRSAGSFYSYFTGKEALLTALLTDLLAHADEQAAGPTHSADLSSRATVRWHVATYWDFARRNQTVITALRQAATIDGEFAQQMRRLNRADLEHMADHLRIAEQHGTQLPGPPEVVASLIMATLAQFAEFWLGPGASPEQRSDEETIETLTSFIARGIGIRD